MNKRVEAETREMDRQIAQNEAHRQTMSDVRVSSWAIILALVSVGAICWMLLVAIQMQQMGQ